MNNRNNKKQPSRFVVEVRRNLAELIALKKTFKYKTVGSSYEFIFSSGRKKLIYDRDARENKNKYCSQLSRTMINQVKKRLKNELYTPINQDNERVHIDTVYFNPDKIKQEIGEPCVIVDISACYFNTARILGVISEEYYQNNYAFFNQLKDSLSLYDEDTEENKIKRDQIRKEMADYKEARNISIGSLGAEYKIEYYENGILNKAKTLKYKRPTNVCRLDIIDHVWKIAQDINNKIGRNVLMYHTDGFFIHKMYEKQVCELLSGYGYFYKIEEVLFVGIKNVTDNYVVYWDKRPLNSKIPFNINPKEMPYSIFNKNNIIQ